MVVNLEALREYAYWLAAGSILLLLLVLIPGIGFEVNGARRWMDFGFMRLQVSEIGKLGLIFSMAHYLATHRRDFNLALKGCFYPCVLLAIFCVLIILEPDYGTAFLCGAVGSCLMFLAGVRLRFLIPHIFAALSLFSVAIYHALVTSGFNIFLLELLLLYFASATSIALTGPGNFSIDEVIIRVLRSESNDENVQESVKTKTDTGKLTSKEDLTKKGGIFQFLQANLLSDTSN